MNINPKKISNPQLKVQEFSINHQKLIDATIETIAKRGLADTTIAQVAKKAMVSQGYANFRFKSKENLLLGLEPISIAKTIFLFFRIAYPPSSLESFLKV